MKRSYSESHKGFTLIEVIIVIAIVGILGGMGIGYYFNYLQQTTIKSAGDKIGAFLYSTQQKSIGQEASSQWGVHFENPTGATGSFFASFKGSSYTTPEEKIFLEGYDYQFPADGTSVDVSFNKITGKVAGGTVKKVIVQLPAGGAAKTIRVMPTGSISVSDGEVGWWRLNDGTGTSARDISPYQWSGTLSSGATFVASGCKEGGTGCVDFSGSGGYIDGGTRMDLDLPNQMTAAAWIKPDSVTGTYAVVSRGNSDSTSNFWLDIRSSNQIFFGGYTAAGAGTYVSGTYTFTPGTWYHVAGVDDGTNLKIYVNGKQVASGARATRISGNFPMRIGMRAGSGSYFDGQIDDVHIYDRGLNADEISRLYERTK